MLRRATDQLVIKPRLSSTARLLVALAAVLVLILASVAGYLGGRGAEQLQLDSRAEQIDRLKETLQQNRGQQGELQSKLDTARQRLAKARQKLDETRSSLTQVTRQLQVDQSAYSELRRQLEESNQQITRLGSELQFYRSIISPSDGQSGVRIQALRLESTDVAREYRYKLTLIQALDHEKTVNGMARLEIGGMLHGSEQTVRVPQAGGDVIAAKFRYFQNLTGSFRLPEGFVPDNVKVVFEMGRAGTVDRVYPWPASETPRDS